MSEVTGGTGARSRVIKWLPPRGAPWLRCAAQRQLGASGAVRDERSLPLWRLEAYLDL